MALPIINDWKDYFKDHNEGLGSSYERIILNYLLDRIISNYGIKTVLEAPSFGFTGITGLNSMKLIKDGCDVTLIDHDSERIELMKNMIISLNESCQIIKVSSYSKLLIEDKSIDMSWNFSALWFVEDLMPFLSELTRITNKVILICVPNQSGFGYKWQKANSHIPEGIVFNENFISPILIKAIMKRLDWQFIDEDYFDCPLWPDIGMSKEKFFNGLLHKTPDSNKLVKSRKAISIVDYYKGVDSNFPQRMMKYAFFERHAPRIFKMIWSHHKWMLFIPNKV
jgi:ubiquinone/menaquinone biosynthesis C-methylase UbiE